MECGTRVATQVLASTSINTATSCRLEARLVHQNFRKGDRNKAEAESCKHGVTFICIGSQAEMELTLSNTGLRTCVLLSTIRQDLHSSYQNIHDE